MISALPVVPASILVTWSVPDLRDDEAPLTGYAIWFFVDDGFTLGRRATQDEITVQVGLQTSHLQTGLRPNTDYRIEVAAVNLIGIGPFSSSLNFLVTSGEGSMLSTFL